MMRLLLVAGLLALAGCGGGGTTGTNYSEAPPMAEIVATPSPKPSETPVVEEPPAVANSDGGNASEGADAGEADNASEVDAPANSAE